jgi:hypothetical protein
MQEKKRKKTEKKTKQKTEKKLKKKRKKLSKKKKNLNGKNRVPIHLFIYYFFIKNSFFYVFKLF